MITERLDAAQKAFPKADLFNYLIRMRDFARQGFVQLFEIPMIPAVYPYGGVCRHPGFNSA